MRPVEETINAMVSTPVVSVIMPNYNGANYLEAAVASLQAQTLQSWELLFIDDASPDDSVAVANRLALGDERVRVLVQEANQGPGAARNRGLAEARGEWIAIFDSDDVMAPERLERMIEAARADGRLLVADNQQICASDLTPQSLFLPAEFVSETRSVSLAQFVDSSRLYSNWPDLGFIKPLIAASLIEQAKASYPEDLRIGEDFHFMVQLLATGAEIRLLPEAMYFYRKHSSSISHRLSRETLQAMIESDERLQARIAPVPTEAQAAFARRRRGLHSWQAYDRFIENTKQGRVARGMAAVLLRPHAWGLAARPVSARLKRLMGASRAG